MFQDIKEGTNNCDQIMISVFKSLFKIKYTVLKSDAGFQVSSFIYEEREN